MKALCSTLANGLVALHLVLWLSGSAFVASMSPLSPSPETVPSPSNRVARPDSGLERREAYFWERGPMRGIWLDRGRLPRSREDAVALMSRLVAMGITDVFAETYARGSAVSYLSERTVNDPRTRVTPGWLPMFIDTAHAAGLKVHAWAWMLCCATGGVESPLMAVHPEWLARSAEGETVSEWGSWWLCPSSPAVHDHLEAVVAEMVTHHDFDGVNLDYMRVDGDGDRHYCYCDGCRRAFLAEHPHRRSEAWPPHRYDPDFRRWRWRCIDGLVARLSRAVRRTRPGTRVSCCVLPRPKFARRMCGQNWLGWLERGDLDFACALTYDPRPDRLERFARVYAPHLARHLAIYPGIALHKTDGEGAIALLRRLDGLDFEGFSLFSYRQLRPEVELWLGERWGGPRLARRPRAEGAVPSFL